MYSQIIHSSLITSRKAVHRDIKPENMMVSRVPRQAKLSRDEQNSSSHKYLNKMRGQSVETQSGRDGINPEEDSVYVLKICDFG
jgi:serine/threonine protein kinase